MGILIGLVIGGYLGYRFGRMHLPREIPLDPHRGYIKRGW